METGVSMVMEITHFYCIDETPVRSAWAPPR